MLPEKAIPGRPTFREVKRVELIRAAMDVIASAAPQTRGER